MTASDWKSIAELDRSVCHFVLIHEDGIQNTGFWSPSTRAWEHSRGIQDPSHFMDLPENPPATESETE